MNLSKHHTYKSANAKDNHEWFAMIQFYWHRHRFVACTKFQMHNGLQPIDFSSHDLKPWNRLTVRMMWQTIEMQCLCHFDLCYLKSECTLHSNGQKNSQILLPSFDLSKPTLRSVLAPPNPYVAEPNNITFKSKLCSFKNRSKSAAICVSWDFRWTVRNIRSIAFGIIAWVICSTSMPLFDDCINATVLGRPLTFRSVVVTELFSDELAVFAASNDVDWTKWLSSSTVCHRVFRLFLLPLSVLAFESVAFVAVCSYHTQKLF